MTICPGSFSEGHKNVLSEDKKQEAQRATYRAPEYNVPPF